MSRDARIYVGNLPRDCREREIEDIFYKYGRIVDIAMKGPFCFVSFEGTTIPTANGVLLVVRHIPSSTANSFVFRHIDRLHPLPPLPPPLLHPFFLPSATPCTTCFTNACCCLCFFTVRLTSSHCTTVSLISSIFLPLLADSRDAKDAVHYRDGYEFGGARLR